ncbi:MAG: hopanoid biosynthesis-associated protein HpnK [Alphaproteobacteria bacterium]|nr:hopanoid biosynthesis-associated protein HpnK [Alphaproteobacteria bacterium]
MKPLIVCADDFGLHPAINEAVELAHRDGILTCASLMVGAPAVADAVARAHRLPRLRVGLHLVLADGRPVLPPAEIPDLVGRDGSFDDRMARAGARFFLRPAVRRQLAREIRAQFAAFRATGLALDHINAHKHFHLHPTIAALMVAVGRDFGLTAMRVPAEPYAPLRRAAGKLPVGARIAAGALALWAGLLRRRLRRAGIVSNDHLFGLAWTGAMTEQRLLDLLPHLPAGVNELYFHPATESERPLTAAMPAYRHADELAALLSGAVRRRIDEAGFTLVSYRDLRAA